MSGHAKLRCGKLVTRVSRSNFWRDKVYRDKVVTYCEQMWQASDKLDSSH